MRLLLFGTLVAALLAVVPAAQAAALQTSAGGAGTWRGLGRTLGALGFAGTLAPPLAQRVGRGRGVFRPRPGLPRRSPGMRPRRPVRSPSLRRIGAGILRFLGIAFLLNLLFGWGSGGSPLGLLLVVGFVAWLVLRRRRRPVYTSRY